MNNYLLTCWDFVYNWFLHPFFVIFVFFFSLFFQTRRESYAKTESPVIGKRILQQVFHMIGSTPRDHSDLRTLAISTTFLGILLNPLPPFIVYN